MTVGELIQRVQSLYSHGVQSDDSRLSSRHIYNKLKSVRMKLLYDDLKKKKSVNAINYQTLPCVELIKANIQECGNCLPTLGCDLLRSKLELPKTASDGLANYIESVTSVDGTIRYTETQWSAKKYKKGNKYTSHIPDFYLRNNFLYITWVMGPRILTITGLFEDPIEVATYPSACKKKECLNPYTLEFPIEGRFIEALIEIAYRELIEMFSASAQDLSNNSTEDRTHQPIRRNYENSNEQE